jgi:hypothetical protein
MRPSCSNGPSLSCELHQVTHSITTTNTVTRDSPNTMVITFSEPVWGFTIADITVTNAVSSAFTGVDGDTVFGVDLSPSTEDFVTVLIHSATCQDEGTNDNTASTLVTYRYEATSPPQFSGLLKRVDI